jgi:DUF2934 family protein
VLTARTDCTDTPGARPFERTPRRRDERPSHERIAARAYRIWEEAGRPERRDWEHWLQAERELSTSPFATRTPPY